MAKGAMDPVRRRDPKNLNNKMSLAEVKALTPSFDWNLYLSLVKAPSSNPHYRVTSLAFFKSLEILWVPRCCAAWQAPSRPRSPIPSPISSRGLADSMPIRGWSYRPRVPRKRLPTTSGGSLQKTPCGCGRAPCKLNLLSLSLSEKYGPTRIAELMRLQVELMAL
jgi:hypothetical protein